MRKTRMIAQITVSSRLLKEIERSYDTTDGCSIVRRALGAIVKDVTGSENVHIVDFRDPQTYGRKFNMRVSHTDAMISKLKYTQEELSCELQRILSSDNDYIDLAAERYLIQKGRLCLLKNTP